MTYILVIEFSDGDCESFTGDAVEPLSKMQLDIHLAIESGMDTFILTTPLDGQFMYRTARISSTHVYEIK